MNDKDYPLLHSAEALSDPEDESTENDQGGQPASLWERWNDWAEAIDL